MQNRMKPFLSAVLLIIMLFSMVSPVLATETEPATEPTTEPTTEHEHTWTTLSATTSTHYLFCTTCEESKEEPHTFNSEEVCIVCGRYFHTHKWQRIEADSQFHTIVCTSCGESKTVTHSMSEGICTVCGYETHTHVMEYVGGTTYGSEHEMQCMFCNATRLEQCTYGSDDKCTVCGAERPCEHQWVCNGEQYFNRHVLACVCGQTMEEPHNLKWNAAGKYAVCTVCGYKDSGHCHIYIYPDGTHCLDCGYNRGSVESGNQPNGTGPAETRPAETDPVDTEPIETEPIETEQIETEPIETEAIEVEPTETNSIEVAGGEANPAQTEAEASDTIGEEDGEADSQPEGSALVWVVAVVFIAAGLTTGLFLWKKKSSK